MTFRHITSEITNLGETGFYSQTFDFMPLRGQKGSSMSALVNYRSKFTHPGLLSFKRQQESKRCWWPQWAGSHLAMPLGSLNAHMQHDKHSTFETTHIYTTKSTQMVNPEFPCFPVTVPKYHACPLLTFHLCLTSKQYAWENHLHFIADQ